ncbi:PREDICTED: microtubule-associated tumor suppressor candidate 2 [Nanorana parkeri]|uniref:microtubule-associated tumor suppressor candidate 2 n=1 Tax=Nanorana parkeri TaxID=125878 RepID=UPI0008544C22|nr:PREDICTED: microtubule-associated tumor suppressor candidate 2 [Nanorana parkeri]
MSIPLTPSKVCCTDREDNSNAEKNDNESVASLGDTNANQIFTTETYGDKDEISRVDKTVRLGTWQSENFTQLTKEPNSLVEGSNDYPTSEQILSDQKLQAPTNQEISKEYMTDNAKDSLKIFNIQGQSLNLKVSFYDRSSQIPISKTNESSIGVYSNTFGNVTQGERSKVKSGIPSPKLEPFLKEHISPTSPSRYSQYFDTSSCGIRTTDISASTDHFLKISSHILSNTSEEKKIVIYSKTPTSSITVPDSSMIDGTVTHVNKQSTLTHPTHADDHFRLTYKPQVFCNVPEAQLYQGPTNKPSELPDSKSLQSKLPSPHRLEQISLGEAAVSKRVDSMFESRRSPLSSPCGQGAVPHTSKMVKPPGTFLSTSPSNTRQHDFQADIPFSETKVPFSQVCNIQTGHVQVPESLRNKELSSKPVIRKTTSLTDSLDNKISMNKDRHSAQDYLCQDSDNFLSSSNVMTLKDKIAVVDSKKASLGRKHQSDVLKGSLKDSHRDPTDFVSCTPSPSCPVAAVNINDQRVASPSSFKDPSTAHVDRLSPSPVLPPIESTQLFNISPKATNKTVCNSGIPKPILVLSKPSIISQAETEINYNIKPEETIEQTLIFPKPKNVRPKIITYIRRNPQAVDRLPFGQMNMPYGPPVCSVPIPKEHDILSSDVKPTNVLLDKYKTDVHKPRIYSTGLMVSGIRPPGHHSLEETGDRQRKDDFRSSTFTHYEVPPSFYRSTMILKPQLGLGAMSRLPSVKSRILIASQRSSSGSIPHQELVTAAATSSNQEATEELKKGSITNGAKSSLPKPCQTALRPPSYSRLPAAKLAAFGFVRSSSVSSLSSNQSTESIQGDQSRAPNTGMSFVHEDQPAQNTVLPLKEIPKGTNRTILEVCNNTNAPRRSLLPAKKTTTSPAGLKKETQKDQEVVKPTISSPKKQVTKLHSPGHPKLKPSIVKNGYPAKSEAPIRDPERHCAHRLKEKCEEKTKELLFIREEFKKASCAFVVFAVTTQYFFSKSETSLMKERELQLELATIRDEVAFNTAKCEKLQKEKEELEIKFDNEVRKLERYQQEELQALKERLQLQCDDEMERLRAEQSTQLQRILFQHKGQIEDMSAIHEASLLEIKYCHSASVSGIHEDHEKSVHELKENHELEKKMLEDGFEILRLSLQDQVDTLTFQNHSLRDRAKMFEEALMKSTKEQLEIALAPYKHLDEDLASVKQVLEMKNQLIHQQEKRIMELEKLAEINVILEERIQVLQQQNEDMRVRIHQNVAVTRQLSVENANLHESVEKESKEKKRLSRTNEELVWKLQSAESMSPIKHPSSPINHSSSSSSLSPSKISSAQR